MSSLKYQQKFCEAREIISDHELDRLTHKYHKRHPIFSIEIHERTCKTITLGCMYHYRHIRMCLKCQCIYDENLHNFQSHWFFNDVEYKNILEDIVLHLNSILNRKPLDEQFEFIIEQITNYFIQLKSNKEEKRREQSSISRKQDSNLPIEIIKYSFSPQSQRQRRRARSLSWSKPLTLSQISSIF